MPDPMGSHIEYLTEIIDKFGVKDVVEFGCGDYSTALFVSKCASVLSIEMQNAEWFEKVMSQYIDVESFRALYMPGPVEACEYVTTQTPRVDLVFVDGHPERWRQVNAAFHVTDTIVVHDSEASYDYHWDLVNLPRGWKWVELYRYIPRTSIITKRKDIAEWAETKNAEIPLFEPLKQHSQIVVTGPPRSGTRICTEMIAHDLGYEVMYQESVWNKQFRLVRYNMQRGPTVYQVPTIVAWAHKLAFDVAVVFVRRSIEEIRESEARIGWSDGPGKGQEKALLQNYFLEEGNLPDVVYRMWDKYQRWQVKYDYEIQYEDLAQHPLWIPKEKRVNFEPWQTRL